MAISDEEWWPWKGRREGTSRFIIANCELLIVMYQAVSPPPLGHCPVIFCSGEPGGMVGVEVTDYHLISAVLQENVKVRGIVQGT